MPSVYACVFYTDATSGTKYVLPGKKRTQARWLNWDGTYYDVPFQAPAVQVRNRVPYDIVNNPGQPVFPGGGLGPRETPVNGALREFLEETGVDLTRFYSTAPSYPNTIKFFNSQGQVVLQGQPFAFAAVYFELSAANFQGVYAQAFQNILYNNLVSRPPNTKDDELDFVCSLPVNDASQWFSDTNDRSCNRKSTGWFSDIVNNIP